MQSLLWEQGDKINDGESFLIQRGGGAEKSKGEKQRMKERQRDRNKERGRM